MKQYFVMRDNQQFGPYDENQMKELLAQSRILSSDYAWTETVATWLPINAFPEFVQNQQVLIPSRVPEIPSATMLRNAMPQRSAVPSQAPVSPVVEVAPRRVPQPTMRLTPTTYAPSQSQGPVKKTPQPTMRLASTSHASVQPQVVVRKAPQPTMRLTPTTYAHLSGTSQPQASVMPQEATRVQVKTLPYVPNYMTFGIVSLIVCLPCGIVSMVYASQVDLFLRGGQLSAARRASDNAKNWGFTSLYVTGILLLISIFLGFAKFGLVKLR